MLGPRVILEFGISQLFKVFYLLININTYDLQNYFDICPFLMKTTDTENFKQKKFCNWIKKVVLLLLT